MFIGRDTFLLISGLIKGLILMASLALILVEGVGQYMESSCIEIKSVRPYYDVFLVPLYIYSIFELTSILLLLNLILTWHGG